MNPCIYDIIKNVGSAIEADLQRASDQLEFLYHALNAIDPDLAEDLIAQLHQQSQKLRQAT